MRVHVTPRSSRGGGADGASAAQPSKPEGAVDRPPNRDKKEVTWMRPWTRLQDWGTLIAGLAAAVSPIFG
jgi:hypothetical protein